MRFKHVLVASAAAVIAAVAIGSGNAQAAVTHLIGSQDIKDNSVRLADIRDGAEHKLSKDSDSLEGAFYATHDYDSANAGAIATVACDSDPAKTDYVAISGGVRTLGYESTRGENNTPVSSSFPGRMMWADNPANTLGYDFPKPDRLDGWIVQFGGNAGPVSDRNLGKVQVWALCVPSLETQVNPT